MSTEGLETGEGSECQEKEEGKEKAVGKSQVEFLSSARDAGCLIIPSC